MTEIELELLLTLERLKVEMLIQLLSSEMDRAIRDYQLHSYSY